MKPKLCDLCKKPKDISKMFFVYDVTDKLAHVMRCFACEPKTKKLESPNTKED